MKRLTICVLGLGALLLMAAAPAVAQQPSTSSGDQLRGYLIGGGGASIKSPTTALTLSAEIAENVTPDVQVYMAAGYYENLMTQTARDLLVRVGDSLTAETGNQWAFTGRDRGRSFTVGGKYLVPTRTPLRPYIGGGFGVLNLRRTVTERTRGEMTAAFLTTYGSGDGIIDAAQTNTNKPLGEVAAGLGVVIGHGYVDLGYRYRKAFRNVDQSFDASQVGVAVGVRF